MMKFKSSYKMPNRRKINLALFAVALLLARVWLSPRTHAADSAPDWLRAAAAETLPDYPKDAVAVMLLDELHATVKDNGDIENTYRCAYKFLRPQARDDYGYAMVRFDNQTKVSFFRAWTIMPNGAQIEVKNKEASEVGLADGDLYNASALTPLRTIGGFNAQFQLVVRAFLCNCPPDGNSPTLGPTSPNRNHKPLPTINTCGNYRIFLLLKLNPICRLLKPWLAAWISNISPAIKISAQKRPAPGTISASGIPV
jgi:hypothetical protein